MTRKRISNKDFLENWHKITLLEQMRSNFTSIISREIEEHIGIIDGYLGSIVDGILGEIPPPAYSALLAMSASALKVKGLTSELMLFFKDKEIENVTKRSYSLRKIFEEAVAKVRKSKKEELMKVNIEIMVEGRLYVYVDRDKFIRALCYLLENSVSFTPEGGRIILSGEQKDNWLTEICVQDTGIGIDKDQLSRIFDPFYKSLKSGYSIKRTYENLGLGLFIFKHIIQAHWGQVTVESEVGKGTLFIIDLPSKSLLDKFKKDSKIPSELASTTKKFDYESLFKNWYQQEFIFNKLKERSRLSEEDIRNLYNREKQKTKELQEALKVLQSNYIQTIQSLSKAIDARNPYTHNHSKQVALFARMIADEMGMDREEVDIIYTAGLFHDIGKIGISDDILLKKDPLTNDEYNEIKKHPDIGVEILQNIDFVEKILPGIKYHQERFDGRGYPNGLRGRKIPLVARILAIADSFDAMTSVRPYRPPKSYEVAIKELQENKGRQFDPELVDVFIKILREKAIIE